SSAMGTTDFHRSKESTENPMWSFLKNGFAPQSIPVEQSIMTTLSPIRILSVDDHPLLREGICATVNSQPDMSLEAFASNGKEAIEQFRSVRPDVTLMDLRLPDLNGIDTTIAIRAEFSDARIIILTTFERDVEIQRALRAGAYGFLLKSM